MSIDTTVHSRGLNADHILQCLTSIQTTRKDSTTMELDKSQPPTPDGSGHPANFQVIAPGLYRSSYPAYPHFDALRHLQLKTIITLVQGDISLDYGNFVSSEGIVHHQIPILANKDSQIYTDAETVHKVLNIVLDPSNFPLLIHCNKGRHRTGCMVACFRKITGWSLDACIDEYVTYSTPKERELDKRFIERFDPSSLKPTAYARGFVGGVYKQPIGTSEESTKSSLYTNNTIETYTSNEDEHPNYQYQEAIRRSNNDIMESSRRWSSYWRYQPSLREYKEYRFLYETTTTEIPRKLA